MKRNTAGQKIGAQIITAADGTAFTGSVTVYVTKDAGTQVIGTVGSGAATDEGNGYYTYAPSQAETDGDLLAFTFIGSGAIPVTVQVVPSSEVWDIVQADHTTAGTMGKTLDVLRKSNPIVEGTVLASPAPTATTFTVSGLTYPTGAFKHAVLWFADDATLAEQNSPILTYTNNGDGTSTIVLEEALTSAPIAGDTVLIDPTSHVHAVAAIQSGLALQSTLLIVAGYIDTEVSAIKTVTDRLNTGLVADGGVWQFTANMLELAPGGGGGGSATLENQELILDEIDSLRSAFATAVGRLAVASQIIGFPTVIVRNSDYSTITESEIRLSLNDLDGDPITEIGGVACASIDWLFGIGSERAPQLIEGAATWDAGTNQLVIQIGAEDTAETPLGSLSWQIGCTIGTTTRFLGGGTTRLIERQF